MSSQIFRNSDIASKSYCYSMGSLFSLKWIISSVTSILVALSLSACSGLPAQLAKNDIDRLADQCRRSTQDSLLILADKLYQRNPQEWKKGGHLSRSEALKHLEDNSEHNSKQVGKRSTALVIDGFRQDYPYDRVAAFIGGLLQMLDDAFGNQEEFFLFDELDSQKLYHAARNVEIAAWKLATARFEFPQEGQLAGKLMLLSNEIQPVANLSFEREFGRLIGVLDLLAEIISNKNQTKIVKAVQNVVTLVFFPI